jgi:transcriptional regulator with XRE-family HTH domain
MATPSAFGVRLRRARRLAGLSPTVLSRAVGKARDVVRQIEIGLIQKPNVELAARLAKELGVTLDWLASGIGAPPRKAAEPRTGTDG